MTWIFGSFLVTSCALLSCHILISKQEDDSTSGHSGLTGVEPEGDHVMRTTRSDLDSAENCSRAWDTQPIRGVSDELVRYGC